MPRRPSLQREIDVPVELLGAAIEAIDGTPAGHITIAVPADRSDIPALLASSGLHAAPYDGPPPGSCARSEANNRHLATLGRALAAVGRVPKTIHLLDYCNDPIYRRAILGQINRGEGRHELARCVCHGNKGELPQPYQRGQEEQIGALGLVVNCIVLDNTIYTHGDDDAPAAVCGDHGRTAITPFGLMLAVPRDAGTLLTQHSAVPVRSLAERLLKTRAVASDYADIQAADLATCRNFWDQVGIIRWSA